MTEEEEEEGGAFVARLLRQTAGPTESGSEAERIARTLRRVRNWILMGDLLRLATLEALWVRLPLGSKAAEASPRCPDGRPRARERHMT